MLIPLRGSPVPRDPGGAFLSGSQSQTQVGSDEDLIKLYRRHDRLIAPRTISDALTAEGIAEQFALRQQIATTCFRAIPLMESRFRGVRFADSYLTRSDEARLRMAAEWWCHAAAFQEYTRNGARQGQDHAERGWRHGGGFGDRAASGGARRRILAGRL